MAEYHFTTQSPLGGYKRDFAGVTVLERTDCSIASIGVPVNGKKQLQAALLDGFGLKIPKMGRFTTSGFANASLLGLHDSQYFLVSHPPSPQAAIDRLEPAAYLTDQSDSWVILSVTGDRCRAVLARICPIDLHPEEFPIGKVVRTLMAHLGVIIYRHYDDGFCLLAPSASARSFLHALEAAATSALGYK